jgi:hypothetical protein
MSQDDIDIRATSDMGHQPQHGSSSSSKSAKKKRGAAISGENPDKTLYSIPVFNAKQDKTREDHVSNFKLSAHYRTIMYRLFLATLLAAAVLVIVALTINPSSLPGVLPAVVSGLAPLAAHAIFGTAVAVGTVSALTLGLSFRSSREDKMRAQAIRRGPTTFIDRITTAQANEAVNTERFEPGNPRQLDVL